MNEKSDLTLLCETITFLADNFYGDGFTAEDVKLSFFTNHNREPSGQAVGQAFRICSKNKVIVKVRPVQSQGQGRNGSLVWEWRGV